MAIQQTHVRSISLPSRLPSNNPTNTESIQNLKSLKNIKSSIVFEDIQSGLMKLAQLYNSVQELNQSSASKHNLDSSMELIDSCDTIREMLQMVKENVQFLQSAIRRKGIESSCIQQDIASYLCFRKKMIKNLSKSLKNLKSLENKNVTLNVEQNDLVMALLRETISTFKSTLMYLSCPMVGNSNWNLIAKLMKKSETCERDHKFVTSEIGRLDCVLAAKVIDEHMVQRSLQNVDSCIQGLESGVERLYREMIGCRVKILNILAEY